MTSSMAFWWATGAGFAISIIDYAALHRMPKIERPPTFSDPAYWVKFLGHPLVGGFLALGLFQTAPFTSVTAITVGAAAPTILRALMRSGSAMLKLFVRELHH